MKNFKNYIAWIIFVFGFIAIIEGTAKMAFPYEPGEGWGLHNTVMEFGYMSLLFVDLKQSLNMPGMRDKETRIDYVYSSQNGVNTVNYSAQSRVYHEGNPLLGAHPSKAKMVGSYFIFTSAHAIISYFLPEKYYTREIFQSVTFTCELTQVYKNQKGGRPVSLAWSSSL